MDQNISSWLSINQFGKLVVPTVNFTIVNGRPVTKHETGRFSECIGLRERQHPIGYTVIGVITRKKYKTRSGK